MQTKSMTKFFNKRSCAHFGSFPGQKKLSKNRVLYVFSIYGKMLSCKTSRKSTEQFLRKTCHRRMSKLDRYYKTSSGRAEAPKNSKLQSNTVDALNLYLNRIGDKKFSPLSKVYTDLCSQRQ